MAPNLDARGQGCCSKGHWQAGKSCTKAVLARVEPASREWLFSSVYCWWDHTWSTVSLLRPQHKRDSDVLAGSPAEATFIKRRAGALDNQGKAKRAGFLLRNVRRLGGDIIAVFGCIMGIHRGHWAKTPLRGTQWQSEMQWTRVARQEIPVG